MRHLYPSGGGIICSRSLKKFCDFSSTNSPLRDIGAPLRTLPRTSSTLLQKQCHPVLWPPAGPPCVACAVQAIKQHAISKQHAQHHTPHIITWDMNTYTGLLRMYTNSGMVCLPPVCFKHFHQVYFLSNIFPERCRDCNSSVDIFSHSYALHTRATSCLFNFATTSRRHVCNQFTSILPSSSLQSINILEFSVRVCFNFVTGWFDGFKLFFMPDSIHYIQVSPYL
eukprot:g37055.t1